MVVDLDCVLPVLLIKHLVSYYFALFLPSKMVTCCHMCINYDIMKDHALGSTWRISQWDVLYQQWHVQLRKTYLLENLSAV